MYKIAPEYVKKQGFFVNKFKKMKFFRKFGYKLKYSSYNALINRCTFNNIIQLAQRIIPTEKE